MREGMYFESVEQAKGAGIEYAVLVGRRQPMHKGHLATILKTMDQGLIPIIIIGSSNSAFKEDGSYDKSFNPISNPLNLAQQEEQIRRSLPGKVEGLDYIIHQFKDVGDNDLWCRKLVSLLKGINVNGQMRDVKSKSMYYFIGKEIDKKGGRFAWQDVFEELGFAAFIDRPHDGVSIDLSATQLRKLNPNATHSEKSSLYESFADLDYIRSIANQARAEDPHYMNLSKLPVTLFDLTLSRLRKEKGVSTANVIDNLGWKPFTLNNLIESADSLNKSTIAPLADGVGYNTRSFVARYLNEPKTMSRGF